MKTLSCTLLLLTFMLLSCTQHKIDVAPIETRSEIEVKPIHIIIDVNIKVDRALDDFFKDID